METYATAVLIAIPFFIILIFIEIGYGYFVKKQMHKPMDTISSLSSGLTNSIQRHPWTSSCACILSIPKKSSSHI